MLPSLNALSLGAPTGARDDVVTEIVDEREADKREWEAWHNEQEMKELPQEMERLRAQARALQAQHKALLAQERSLHAQQKARRAQNEALSQGEVLTLDEAVKRQAVRERSPAPAEARAAAAADSSDDESDDEPLDRRADRLAAKSPPIHTLEPGPFSLIVDELLKRLMVDAEAVNGSDADAMCRDVANVCRELATLNQLPGQAVDPMYNCSNPNSEIWKYAHAIFGVNPTETTWLRGKKPNQLSWKQNFVMLCKAFRPDFVYPVVGWEAAHGGGIQHDFLNVWNQLWRSVPENRQVADAWEEEHEEGDAWEAFLDRDGKSDEEDESDYNEDDAFDSFLEDYRDTPYYSFTRHSPGKDELRGLRAKVRLPIEPRSAQIKWRMDNLPRLTLELDSLYYDNVLPDEHRLDDENDQAAYRELWPKVEAVKRLFKTLRRQAREMQARAS